MSYLKCVYLHNFWIEHTKTGGEKETRGETFHTHRTNNDLLTYIHVRVDPLDPSTFRVIVCCPGPLHVVLVRPTQEIRA